MPRAREPLLLLVGFAAGCALFARPVAFRAPGPGTSKEAAIEVCMPAGEREYLGRLRCPQDGRPSFDRLGSCGARFKAPPGSPTLGVFESLRDPRRRIQPGEVDEHIIDAYRVVCGRDEYEVFLDMYHCGDPPAAVSPPGFGLAR